MNYDEIIKAKEKLDELIFDEMKKIIEEAIKNAEKDKLGPIQTYLSIMEAVNNEMSNIINACDMDNKESFDENLMNRIYELTDPYEEKMEEGLRLFIQKGDKLDTLGELLQHNRELEKIVDQIRDYLNYPEDIDLGRNI